MCEPVYSITKAALGVQPVTDWTTAITIILTALGVILTALAIMVGIVAVWGYGSLKEVAQKVAKYEAIRVAKSTAKEIADRTAKIEVQAIWEAAQSTALVEGEAEAFDQPQHLDQSQPRKKLAKTDSGLRKDDPS